VTQRPHGLFSGRPFWAAVKSPHTNVTRLLVIVCSSGWRSCSRLMGGPALAATRRGITQTATAKVIRGQILLPDVLLFAFTACPPRFGDGAGRIENRKQPTAKPRWPKME
jgi:hypothetical protein